jgi:hypothetical protein
MRSIWLSQSAIIIIIIIINAAFITIASPRHTI